MHCHYLHTALIPLSSSTDSPAYVQHGKYTAQGLTVQYSTYSTVPIYQYTVPDRKVRSTVQHGYTPQDVRMYGMDVWIHGRNTAENLPEKPLEISIRPPKSDQKRNLLNTRKKFTKLGRKRPHN